jgi:hypothetical protein
MRALVVASALAGCHVTVRTELTQTRATRAEPHQDRARAQPATIVLADGALRFVEPLVCPSDEVVEVEPEIQLARRPNLATFVVGVIATAAGAVGAVSAASGDDPGGNPLTYVGAGVFVAGLPFAIGPWLGNRVDTRSAPTRIERRAGGEVACGSRPVAAGPARLAIGDRTVYGAIAADGAFTPSPFTWVDAFDPTGGPAFAVHATLVRPGGRDGASISKVFDAGALEPWRDRFLADTRLDVGVEPLRAVPHLSAGAIRIGHVLVGAEPRLRIQLPITNAGPGDAWQLRATITAQSAELDGRIVYLGHVAAKATVTGELWIPLSPEADDALRGRTIDLAFRLADAHQVVPTESIKFRGPVHDDGFQ